VSWSWTGLQLQPLKDFSRNVYFEGNDGVIVAETDRNRPPATRGCSHAIRILSINGKPVSAITDEDLPELRRLLGMLPKNAPTTLEVKRGDTMKTVTITPREQGTGRRGIVCLHALGLHGQDHQPVLTILILFSAQGRRLRLRREVSGQRLGLGLEAQDIILKVDGKAITSLADLQAVHKATLAGLKDKPRIVVSVLRNGLLRQVVLEISRDYSKE